MRYLQEAAHKGETCNPQGGSIQERIAMLKQKQQSSSPLILPSYASPPIKTPAVDDDPSSVVDGIEAAKSQRLAGLGTKVCMSEASGQGCPHACPHRQAWLDHMCQVAAHLNIMPPGMGALAPPHPLEVRQALRLSLSPCEI